eukprot:TRINITY_DN1629_c0_g1_i1.p1 TRINITY_DN1629_c0_g1~~TRINITY_DN1629_c0_g1_i1.p1  ORF type:complete len:199 (+),score=54.24 TRINITY_DN1629_c0_g1_i1:164-760(+)
MATTTRVDVKIVLLGTQSVGKTSLIERYLYGKFNMGVTATVGAAFGAKKITKDNITLNMGIWDTAGAERYEAMARIYYRQARAAIVCFDLSSAETFGKVQFWIQELLSNEPECDVYIVGTKFDAGRKIDKSIVEDYADKIKAKAFIETSAQTGYNVDELFDTIANNFIQKFTKDGIPTTSNTTNVSSSSDSGKSGCCS